MSTIDRTASQFSALFLCWARGDNDAKAITFTDGNGDPIDVSGWTTRITVNTERNPVDTSTQVFQAQGQLVTDGTDGRISYAPAVGDLDDVQVGNAFYEIERISPDRRTLFISKVTFVQDLGK